MRICIIARSLEKDYSGSFEFDQALALKQKGMDVTLVSMDLRSIRRRRKLGVSEYREKGIDIVKVSIPLGAINKTIFYKISTKALIKVLGEIVKRDGDFDVIHAHFLDNAYITSNAIDVIKSKAKYFITEHTDLTKLKSYGSDEKLREIVEAAFYRANKVIAVSHRLAEILKNSFGLDCIIVNNVVDTELFIKHGDVNVDERTIILSVGNLTKNKRMDLLIDCFDEAFGSTSKYSLYICGEGPERESLLGLVAKKKCVDRVKLLGFTEREKIAEILQKTKLFVLLSESETFGVAFIEAMASGVPVLSSKSGGPEEFIINEVGEVVSEELIVNKLQQIVEKEYDYDFISKYAERKFSPTVIAMKLIEIYSA